MVVFDPFRAPEPSELVKEVIGLANADVEGPRYILFGVNPGAIEGSKVIGIKDDTAAALKKAHRVISEHIEPVVSLAFIFDKFNGKLAGALEIDGAGDGPFVPGADFAADDSGKKTWVRDGRDLRVRGRPRVMLAVYLKALACNLKRMVRALMPQPAFPIPAIG